MSIIRLKHCNHGDMALRLDAITEVAPYVARHPTWADPKSRVFFGAESGWAFDESPQEVIAALLAADIPGLAATCACDRHGQPTWLVRDHIIAARTNGEHTTDVTMRWSSGWRSLALHEPCSEFLKRWEVSFG